MNLHAKRDRAQLFYTLLGVVMAAIVLVGFARTYYLKAWFDTPPLTVRLHLHGFVLTLWVLLFVAQTSLVAAGRRRLHKRLGIAALVLATLVVATSCAVAIDTARLGGDRGGITAADRLFSSVLLGSTFALFVSMAMALRKRPEIHKRLMLLATIAVIGPGMTRAVALVAGHKIGDSHVAVMSVFLLLALLYDWRMRGRPHWILLSGGLLLIASQVTRRIVGASETWAYIGNWLIH